MSQAEALLDGINVDDILINSPYTEEAEPHIVIGTDRFIKVPDALKRIAVQYDHNMRTVTFDCPRYYDGRDMSTMRVYINSMCSDKSRHGYIADNVRVDETDTNMIHFDWTINRPMTDVSGSLAFLVCIRRADSDGNDVNHWNSELNTDMFISSGMESDDNFVEYEYPDVVSQLLDRMDVVESNASKEAMQGYTDAWLRDKADDLLADVTNTANDLLSDVTDKYNTFLSDISNKGVEVLESIPEDYTEFYNLSNETIRTKGDAVVYEASGEVIKVTDSSDDYLRGLRLLGKTKQRVTTGAQLAWVNINIANSPYLGVVCSKTEDGNILLNGTSTDAMWNRLASSDLVAGKTYTLTANKKIALNIWDATAGASFGVKPVDSDSFTFVAPTTGNYALVVENPSGTAFANILADIMLNEGSVGLSWEPYTGGAPSPSPDYPQELNSVDNPKICLSGANLFNSKRLSSKTVGGVTINNNGDGSFTISGTGSTTAVCSQEYSISHEEMRTMFHPGKLRLVTNIKTYPMIFVNLYKNGAFNSTIVSSSWSRDHSITLPEEYFENEAYSLRIGFHANVNSEIVAGTVIPVLTQYDGDITELYKDVQTLSISRSLPGIPVTSGGNYTDSNGQQWVCDEVDFERGVYIQRIYKKTFNGTESWKASSYQYDETNRRYDYADTSSPGQGSAACLSTYFPHNGVSEVGIWTNRDRPNYAEFRIMWAYPTVDDMKSFLAARYTEGKPVECMYILAKPIETPLTATELAAFVYLRSNYPNTTVLNDSGAWMELKYNVDTELFIKNTLGKPTDEQVGEAVDKYVNEHGIAAGATAEEKAQIEQNKKDIGNLKTTTQNAQSTANNAVTAAANAQSTADDAVTAAQNAQSTANEATSEAQNAQQTADNAVTAAQNAQSTANGAVTAAANAHSAANDASAEAQNAQSTANEAVTAAQNAQQTADDAVTAAQNAQTTANEANQKVETLKGIVRSFHSNIVCDASGETIQLSDASDMDLAGMRIFGKTEQKTTTGKNLLDQHSSNWQDIDDNNGITYSFVRDSNGNLLYIIANGTTPDNAGSHSKKSFTLLPAGTYITSGTVDTSSPDTGLRIGKGPNATYVGLEIGNSYTVTLTEETYIAINPTIGAGQTVSNMKFYPMIRPASETDATYEPYTGGAPSPNPEYPQALESVGESFNVTVESTDAQPQTLTIATPNGLPGIPVESGGNHIDANGKQWICDEVDFEKGVYVQRVYRQTYIGSSNENWNKSNSTAKDRFYTTYMVSNTRKPCLCNMAVWIPNAAYENGKCFITFNSSNGMYYLEIIAGDYGTFADTLAWRQHIQEHPLEVLYVLAEEKETPLSEIDPDALAQYATLHTNYSNTTILNDARAEMEVKYVADTKMYVDNKFAELTKALLNNL